MHYVIIGASAAGINAAKTLRKADKQSKITMISKDKEVYSRCMLHHVISGGRSVEGISFIEPDFFKRYEIEWLSDQEVVELHINQKSVVTDKRNVSYDKLLVASGASSFLPPIKGLREVSAGVTALRNIEDALLLKELSQSVKKAIVIGAGLVGMDATVGLLERGVNVHLIEMADRILPIQLDAKSASVYEKLLSKENANIYTNVRVEKVLLEGSRAVGVRLSNDKIIEADLIVVAAGVRPNVKFLQDQMKIDRFGVVTNEHGETSVTDIYAAGDVCGRAPIWPIAVKQGINAAWNMAGQEHDFNDEFAAVNSMNFFNIPTVSIGVINEADADLVKVYRKGAVYKKILLKDSIIIGAILQGEIAYCGALTQVIKNKVHVDDLHKGVFDIGYGDFFHEDEKGRFSYS